MEKFDVEEVMCAIRKDISERKLCADELSYVTYYHNKMLRVLRGYQDLIIFGAGDYGKITCQDLMQHGFDSIRAFCDNKIKTETLCGLEVMSPMDAMKKYPDACFVITPKNYENEILVQLINMGIKIENIKIFNVENTGLITL